MRWASGPTPMSQRVFRPADCAPAPCARLLSFARTCARAEPPRAGRAPRRGPSRPVARLCRAVVKVPQLQRTHHAHHRCLRYRTSLHSSTRSPTHHAPSTRSSRSPDEGMVTWLRDSATCGIACGMLTDNSALSHQSALSFVPHVAHACFLEEAARAYASSRKP